ncbi:MAG: hypothetical protein ACYDH1_15915 [Anaerolineaceae bacterium]
MYNEILDDPKMGNMSDRLWRRTIEIFLLAGKLSVDKSGFIPETDQLAWLLRMDSDDLLNDLKQLEEIGIISHLKSGWFVINFEKRQSPILPAERKRQERNKKKKDKYYQNEQVTTVSRNVTQRTETEYREQNTETEAEAEAEEDISSPRSVYNLFLVLKKTIEKEVGFQLKDNDARETIQEFIRIGVEPEDIREAVAWYKNQGRIVSYAGQLRGPSKVARMKRIQSQNADRIIKSIE